MMGPSMAIEDEATRGVIPRAVDAIFAEALRADEAMEFSIKASYVEIYMERIRDLLDPAGDNLQVGAGCPSFLGYQSCTPRAFSPPPVAASAGRRGGGHGRRIREGRR